MSAPTHTGRLAGKVAVVTGGAQGIGQGIVKRFVEEGARVLMTDIQVEKGQATASAIAAEAPDGAGVTFMRADILQPADIEAMVEHAVATYGRLDILVNNAYWNAGGTAVSIDLDDWNKAQAAMVTAPMLGAKYAVPHMVASGGGSVITISSVHGLLAAANGVAYETAKGALILLTKAMAAEWAASGLQANAIGPGYMITDMNQALIDNPAFDAWVKGRTPAKRWGMPEELVGAAVFLAAPASNYVNGQVIYVDGGMISVL